MGCRPFEVTDQLLLLTDKPSLTAGLDRVLSGVWLVARLQTILTSCAGASRYGQSFCNKKPRQIDGVVSYSLDAPF